MEKIINFGKHKGTTYLQAPIEYLVWLEKTINEDKAEGKVYDKNRLETIEYWLNERYLENDEYDKKEEWALEQEKAEKPKRECASDINMNLTPDDVANFIIGTYGYEFASFIADSIEAKTRIDDEVVISMPVL